MEETKIRVGYAVGSYVLEKMVGAGGFSTVYKARSINPQPEYESIIAVKVLHPRRVERYQIRRFVREAKVAKKMEHPNIVKVYDLKKQDGNYFIFMEFLDADLLECIRNKREIFTLSNIKEVILKAAKGLAYIHKNRIIHRDVNPANILLDFSLNKVKMSDFGLSKKNFLFNKERKEGGTLHYIAPEILKGEKASIKSDIYSFGKTIERVYNELNFDMPDKIKYIVDISTKEIPESRFSSVEDILYILEN